MYGPAGFVSVQFEKIFGGVPWNLYSIPGMAITEAVALAPIAYVFCANALRQSDASLESAAQVCGAGPLRILVPGHHPDAASAGRLQLDPGVLDVGGDAQRAAALRPARRHRRLLDVPVPQRPAVGRPRLHRARRRLGGHPGRHDQPGRRPGQAAQGRRPVRLGPRQGHPPAQARARLGQVGQRRLHRVLRGLRCPDPDRRPGLPLVHPDLHAAAQPVRLPDDEELRDDLHASTPTSSRSATASSSPASARCWSAVSRSWRSWSLAARPSGSAEPSSTWR